MKATIILLVTAVLAVGNWQAFAQENDSAVSDTQAVEAQNAETQSAQTQAAETQTEETNTAEAAVTETPDTEETVTEATAAETAQTTPATETSGETSAKVVNNADGIIMDFRNAPLDSVLSYLSDAAGFIVVMEGPVSGRVSIISRQPISKDEAVDLLNAELSKNGYTAIRDGRKLTIVSRTSAPTRNIPVRTGSNPQDIPINDEIVTQVIPIRYVEAGQLVTDLQYYRTVDTIMVANEAGNSIIVTGTQANIRHLMEIIEAIDNSAEGETIVRSFKLTYANPTDVVTMLSTVFPDETQSRNNGPQLPFNFRGRNFGRGGRGGNNNNNSQNGDRAQKQNKVIAAADLRTQSVVVTASESLMNQIDGLITDMDVPSQRDKNVFTFPLANADPAEVVQVLQNMFQDNSTRRGNSTLQNQQTSALQSRQQQNASSSSTTVGGSTSTTFGGGATGGARRTGTGQLF